LNWHAPAGTAAYLVFRDIMRGAGGLDMSYVAYSQGNQALLDVVAGRVDVVLYPLAAIMPLLPGGQLRLLATTGRNRAPAAPDVLTAAQAGYPALEIEGIHGLFGWRGMPEAARTELAGQAWESLTEPAAAERLRAAGMQARGRSSSATFATELIAQRARWQDLARGFGLRPSG
jgi:tripartite-type tricarboxylate transporter receptor subunit TctC